jgi:RNA polymerase sigma-70 factor (ECF subfamily)
MLGDEAEAHDVAQTAWIKAWEYRSRFNFQSLYTTWVHRIAVNCALDALRKRKRLHRRFVRLLRPGAGSDAPPQPEPVEQSLPSDHLEREELARSIEAAVARLPDEQRTVLVLREFEGYSYAEIAKLLNIKPGTVMSRLFNARKKLQLILEKDPS